MFTSIGFDHHINTGDVFNIYSRGKKPILKGQATILKHEDASSLIEFWPNTELREVHSPKIGDFVNYKW